MATDTRHRTTLAERRRAVKNAIASARLEGLEPTSLDSATDADVRGDSTIDELIAEALGPAGEQPAGRPPQAA